jgi:hypothetical protein
MDKVWHFKLTRERKYFGQPWDSLDDESYVEAEKLFDKGLITIKEKNS